LTRYLLDTSCLIAAVCSWHQHHDATAAELAQRRDARDEVVLAAHTLAEAYSVLTRLPEPHGLKPKDALALMESNWSRARVVALSAAEHWRLIRRCRDSGIAGGAVYDALIAAAARKARVGLVLAWDTAPFERFLDEDAVVRAPRGRAAATR
jgi:predicted nucleic acid-binding protein